MLQFNLLHGLATSYSYNRKNILSCLLPRRHRHLASASPMKTIFMLACHDLASCCIELLYYVLSLSIRVYLFLPIRINFFSQWGNIKSGQINHLVGQNREGPEVSGFPKISSGIIPLTRCLTFLNSW